MREFYGIQGSIQYKECYIIAINQSIVVSQI